MKGHMSCSGLDEVLDARADGTLDAAIAAAMDEHLGRCGACRRHSEGYFATLRALDELRSAEAGHADPLPERFAERLLAALRTDPARPPA